jgi:hypothetical protein
MFIKLMKYFTFSSKLSMFYEVLSRASYDIIFLVLISFIIVSAYAIVAHISFGISDSSFSTFSDSFFSVIIIGFGGLSPIDIYSRDLVWKHFVGITFLLIVMMLANISIAIIGSHFIEFYIEQGHTKLSTVRLIINALIGEQVDESQEDNSTKCKQYKNRFLRWLRNWANGIYEEEVIIASSALSKLFDHVRSEYIC